MARYSSSSSGGLRARLSSFADYLEAITELRTKLLHSSPSYLISNPEELITLVEVAKSTLQGYGISLHTFSSCPEYLSTYKDAYFGLLLQLQAHSHDARPESRDLQVRLSRLLFPLSTKLRVNTAVSRKAVRGGYAGVTCTVEQTGNKFSYPAKSNPMPLSSAPSPDCESRPQRPTSLATPSSLPPNVMLPPPAPLRRPLRSSKSSSLSTFISCQSAASQSRRAASDSLDSVCSTPSCHRNVSQNTVHFKRHRAEPVRLHSECKSFAPHHAAFNVSGGEGSLITSGPHNDGADDIQLDEADTSESSSEGDDSDSDSGHIVVPSHSPLRRSFGIFCTGKGRGAFSSSKHVQRRNARSYHRRGDYGQQREANEDNVDVDA